MTEAIALPFIAAHASQLQQIDIEGQLLSLLEALPSLHTLSLEGPEVTLALAVDLAKLRSVELRLTRIDEAVDERIISMLAPVLTRLSLPRLLSPPAMQLLTLCTALTSLDLPVYGGVPNLAASRLKNIGRCPNNPAILRSYTKLTNLMIDLEHLPAFIRLEHLPVLPSMTSLSLQMRLENPAEPELLGLEKSSTINTHPDVFFAFLQRVIASCPRLQTLTLTGWDMQAAAPLITAFFTKLVNSTQLPQFLRTLVIFLDGSWKEKASFRELVQLSPWLEVRIKLKWPFCNEPREEGTPRNAVHVC